MAWSLILITKPVQMLPTNEMDVRKLIHILDLELILNAKHMRTYAINNVCMSTTQERTNQTDMQVNFSLSQKSISTRW